MKYPNFFTDEEAYKLIRKTGELGGKGPDPGKRNMMLFKLVYRLGLRISEAINLDVSNVVFGETGFGTVTVWRKGGYFDTISMDNRLSDELETYIKDNKIKKGRVFPITRQAAYKILKRAISELGLDDGRPKNHRRGPHSLRHSNAIRMLLGGMSTREVQERLGHSSIRTTEEYLKFLPPDVLAKKNDEIWSEIDEGGE